MFFSESLFPVLQEISLYNKDWNPLFETFKFFDTYKHFLQIDISANTEDDMIAWRGWVESRLRQLTLKVSDSRSVYPSLRLPSMF
jgi:poly(A) polymerase